MRQNISLLKQISRPVLPSATVLRQELLNVLNDVVYASSCYKLLLVCAPEGYGKTTLLADFMQRSGFPCCWYFLDQADTNKSKFISLFIASLRATLAHLPLLVQSLDSLVAQLCTSRDFPSCNPSLIDDPEGIIELLVGIMETHIEERFAIALCNYHEVNTTSFIKQFVERLLQHLPAQCLLIIESRSSPDLNLAPLLARREVFGLGSSALRFSPQEIEQLAHLQGLPTLRIQAFGEPTVFLQDQPIKRWRVSHAMSLCFFLLDHTYPVHKEQICAELWPEKDVSSGQALRTSIYYLRKILGEAAVISRSGFYELDLHNLYGDKFWYDVDNFKKAYKRAKEALRSEDDKTAYKHLIEASKLYRGDYLQSFYDNWCIERRHELRLAYIDTRHQLALISWRRKEIEECARHWQHLLALDPCLEEGHYGLMRCYLRQGKRGLALRQYQRCAATLQEEMEILPGPELQSLYKRLTEQSRLGT
ncbi:hypothetical protein EPA93_02810 [Ktedonosporobacter rubrisoli]|uniref:Bacterial transcriptional activator domain-containing protein n=1 Tax=Ktedonosporobacter rubrisoli TaxID=2509675 RepID=A0A4P6JIT0_KTERU|nr:BTAD domain-containing putative transcriptional regulator [Ktedonosporobacter rubrisoli]QBD74979.1 hypothetical protein EPA93_02810 [Ktedonosporobacter rubrisoli]